MKNMSLLLMVVLLAASTFTPFSFAAESNVKFVINGEPYVTPKGEPDPYVNADYRTLVPVRFFANALGIGVHWNQKEQTATLENEFNKVQITLGEDRIYVNGKTVYMDTKAELKDGRTFIPARFIAEGFGAKIGFEHATNTVSIDLNEAQTPELPEEDVAETDPYGRAIRTENLPKNYADFPYILEEIPNEMYEMPYFSIGLHERFKTPKELYESIPEFTKANVDRWMERVMNYYDFVLNVDYETIDYSWGDQIWENISHGVNEEATRREFREYVDWVKENKIKIEGHVKPEPSLIYDNGFVYYVRAEIEFKVINYEVNENVIYDVLYTDYKDQIEKGKTYKGYFDLEIGTNVGGHWGPTIAVSANATVFENFQIQDLKNIFATN